MVQLEGNKGNTKKKRQMTLEEIIQELLRLYPGTKKIDSMVVAVTEIAGSVPVRLYNVQVTGTMSGNPVNFTYTTGKVDNRTTETQAQNEQVRYEFLYDAAVIVEDVAEKADDDITAVEPDPPNPTP